jgi:hypothetical protein
VAVAVGALVAVGSTVCVAVAVGALDAVGSTICVAVAGAGVGSAAVELALQPDTVTKTKTISRMEPVRKTAGL